MFEDFLVVAVGLREENKSSSSWSTELFSLFLLLLLFHGLFSERDDEEGTRCRYEEGVYRNPAGGSLS